tara:strand:- start:1142 stop:1345 length:204 start_codon:yes stop_codon:yes gene_type:complete
MNTNKISNNVQNLQNRISIAIGLLEGKKLRDDDIQNPLFYLKQAYNDSKKIAKLEINLKNKINNKNK